MSVPLLRTIDLDALQIFKAVVDFGGVTKAAAQLHRVPSNVTTRLKQLEEGLGTKLFHRHSRKLLLSSEDLLRPKSKLHVYSIQEAHHRRLKQSTGFDYAASARVRIEGEHEPFSAQFLFLIEPPLNQHYKFLIGFLGVG